MAADAPIRVLIADDHDLFRRGLRMVLEAEDDIEVVGEAADGQAAVAEVHELVPDVVLMDLRMPRMNGIEATRAIREAVPATRVVVLTVSDEHDDLLDAVRAGATSYLLKEISIEEVAETVREAMRGGGILGQAQATELLHEVTTGGSGSDATSSPLTAQELEVLRRVAAGRNDEEIAGELSVTVAEVRHHVAAILAKLQLGTRL